MSAPSFKPSPKLVEGNFLNSHSVQQNDIGSCVFTPDGRAFRYAKAGASAITAGQLQLAPAPKTNHHNCALAADASAGANQITVTLGATAATANEYKDGFVIFSDVSPEGIALKIEGHPAAGSGEDLTLTLTDALPEDATTSSEVSLVHNSWNGVVEGTSTTQKPAGVALVDISAGEFGWLQTKGPAPLLADSTIDLGATVVAGSATAGAVDAMSDTAATAIDQMAVGKAIVAGVDGEFRPVELTID
jgi:hypothetical protein